METTRHLLLIREGEKGVVELKGIDHVYAHLHLWEKEGYAVPSGKCWTPSMTPR